MSNLPEAVLPLVEALQGIPGIRAIVLGGSRARGSHTPASDVDLGLYYRSGNPLEVQNLDQLASQMDDRHQSGLVTPIGRWGPRINGGGWLKIAGCTVDLLYRDLDLVKQSVDACLAGSVSVDIQPGHPFGFLSSTYAAEIVLCLPLRDPYGEVAALKNRLSKYPAPLKEALIRQFTWEIEFNIEIAKKAVSRLDIVYVSGCLFRSVECMLVVLFALNEEYWMNEKGALAATERFAICPSQFKIKVEASFEQIKMNQLALDGAIKAVAELGSEVNVLALPFLSGN